MYPKRNFKKLGILAAGLCLIGTGAANATTGTSKFVKDVSLTFTGQAAQITIKNEANNKHINFLDLKVQESKLYFDYTGSATCKNGNYIHGAGAYMYFGPVSINGDKISSFGTLHFQNKMPISWHDGDKVVEHSEGTFNVPLSKLKQGHPALRVDAIDELEKKAQAYVQGGGTLIDFYRQDQHLVLQRPISLAATCANNNMKGSFGYETKNHTIQITYKGDPALNDKAQLSAALVGKLGGNGEKMAPETPFRLMKADFMPNIPHYSGKCVPDKNPKIRINFKTIGSEKGVMDLVVEPVQNTYAADGFYYQTQGIVNDPAQSSHLDFNFPLKEMLSQEQYSYMKISSNKTFHHNMRIKVRWKPLHGGEWSEYKDFDTAVFNHRCVAQVAVPLGGAGGKLNYGGKPKPTVIDKFQAPKPAPKPIDKIQAVPVTPTEKPKRATN